MAENAIAEIRSEADTARLAESLASKLRAGTVLLLDGPLGAGKTTLVRALARAFGATETVFSPTFTYENRYALASGGRLLHVDLYRLDGALEDDLLASIHEARAEGAIVAVEWGAAWRAWLTPCLELSIDLAGESRRFELRSSPPGWKHMGAVAARWQAIAAEALS